MIVSKKTIPFFRNNALNEDYKNIDLMIPKAAIMAYYNMPKINVIKNYEELAKEESLFSVFFASTFSRKLQDENVGCCTYIL